MDNTTQTTATNTNTNGAEVSEKTEAQITAEAAAEHERIMGLADDDPEKMAYVRAAQERFDAWAPGGAAEKAEETKEKNDEVLTRAQTALSNQGFAVDPDKAAQIVVNSEVPDRGKDSAQVASQVVASVYGDKLNNVGGQATQAAVEQVVEQVGAVDAARIKDMTLHGHVEEAGQVLENAAGSDRSAAELEAETQAKLNEGEGLSAEEQATAEVLDMAAGENKGSEAEMEAVEGQIAELQTKLDNKEIGAEEVTKLKELQNTLVDLKARELFGSDSGGVMNMARVNTDMMRADEVAAALRRAQELAVAS
jgi:hypothetical protein